MRIAVVAFGDASHGDDAIGIELISQVNRRDLPEHAIFINGGTDVLKTLESLSDFEGLVIVDAASMGEAPGTVKTFSLNDLFLTEVAVPITLHGMKMDSELLYANKFLSLPPTMIVGIEPESLTGEGISEVLRSNLDTYIEAVNRAITQLHL